MRTHSVPGVLGSRTRLVSRRSYHCLLGISFFIFIFIILLFLFIHTQLLVGIDALLSLCFGTTLEEVAVASLGIESHCCTLLHWRPVPSSPFVLEAALPAFSLSDALEAQL